MENGELIKKLVLLTGMLGIPVFSLWAYDAETTHPALTQEIIQLFEHQFPHYQLTETEKAVLEQGSQEEDSPNLRCLAHFYDPIYEEGLFNNISAKHWAQSPQAQGLLDIKYNFLLGNFSQELFKAKTDFSFGRAVYEYVYGDKLRGLESLGHILHLIEDMAVPPHTRNDSHALGSPYEEYAKRWTKDTISVTEKLLAEEKMAYLYDNLDDYFYHLALFTNQNFFSEDTILVEKYLEPIISYEKKETLSDGVEHTFGFNKINSRLIEIEKNGEFDFLKRLEKQDIFIFGDIDNLIFTDYWSALSKEAVLYGAGVMKLFFDKVEEEQQTLVLYNKNKSGVGGVAAKVMEGIKKTLAVVSSLTEKVQKSVSKINSQDLMANLNQSEENEEKGEEKGEAEETKKADTYLPSSLSLLSPESPNSSELQRLALILNEAEKMIQRLETDINNLEYQNMGGTREDFEEEMPEENPVILVVTGQDGGGGGGGAPSSSFSSSSQQSNATTAPITIVATTTPTINPPQITFPANFSQLATSTITFSGTASSTQIISTDFSNATTTVNQSNHWEIILENFSQGTTTLQFFANDNQATSNPTEIEIFVEFVTSTPPKIVLLDAPTLKIAQCENSMLTTACWVATTTLDISWATTTSCADFSHFNFNNNGVMASTTATSTQVINLADNTDWIFEVGVEDIYGNISPVASQIVTIKLLPVVINEIAWAGTDASVTDEWIELYNLSNEEIDLTDWLLYSQDGSPKIFFSGASNKTISAKGYYLIERTDDTTINDISADLVTPFSGEGKSTGLSNNGEHLILAYKKDGQATTTIDEVAFSQNEGGWSESGEICSYGHCRTLEKYEPGIVGTNRENWGLSIGQYILNGQDVNGNNIGGTPRARNSINYKIAKGNSLSENKTLTKDNSPYFVGSDGLTVKKGAKLKIEEDVIIKIVQRYDKAEIIINGSLEAIGGEKGNQVIFTVFSDDTGGDTNGDGDCIVGDATHICPGVGNNFWSQIVFDSAEQSNFKNTIFVFGGNRCLTTYPESMVVVKNSEVDFQKTSFEESYSSGLLLEQATSTIDECYFKNNQEESESCGLSATRSYFEIRNSVFDGNYKGLMTTDSSNLIIDNNFFQNNVSFPLTIANPTGLKITNNSGINNGTNGINLSGYLFEGATELDYNPLPYVIDNVLIVAEKAVLEIKPQTTFKFDKNGTLGVEGYLGVKGGIGDENKIIFTSLFEKEGVATSSIAKVGGINIMSASSTIENAEFRYLKEATNYMDLSNYYSGREPLPAAINLKDVVYRYNYWSIKTDTLDNPIIRAENIICDQSTTNTTGICQ